MTQSIFVYVTVSLLMYYFGLISKSNSFSVSEKNKKSAFYSLSILFAIILFSITFGARWNVGVDHLQYLNEYQHYKNFGRFMRDNFEIGFEFITSIFALNGIHFFWYFFFFGIIMITPIYYFSKDFSFIYPYIGPVIILGIPFLNWTNGMRQNLAACLSLLIFHYLIKRKLIKYAFFVFLLSFLIHKSAIFLIIISIIPYHKINLNRISYLLLYFFAIYLGNIDSWVNLLKYSDVVASYSGYTNYSLSSDYFIDNFEIRNVGIRSVLIMVYQVAIIWFYPILKQRYEKFNFDIMFKLYFIGIFFAHVFKNSHHIFLRPLFYFDIFSIFVTCFLLDHFINFNNSKRFPFYLFIIFSIFSYTLLSCYADLGKGLFDFSNYKFFGVNN